MGQLINIEGIDWIRNVANSLQIIFNELQDVNKLLSNFDDYLQQSGKAREFNYSYKSQRAAIQNLEDDLQIYQSCFPNYFNHSLADFVDTLIDNPFYKSLEQAVKELSLAQIDRYSTDSVGGIGLKPRQENTSPYSQNLLANQRITINDVLNTQLSKDMLRLQYEDFLKLVFPWTENLSLVDFQIYYEGFLGYIIGIADFDFKTGKDAANDFIKKSLYIIGILASGGTLAGALLGKNLIGLKLLTMATTGTSTLMDIIMLLSGTDANGNSLTEVELSALGKKVALQASALGIGLYLTVSSIKGNDTVSTMKGADSFDDWLKGMSPEDVAKYTQWQDLKSMGFSAEELYNLKQFGSIKTHLNYTTSSGLTLTATPGKTTTILGTYNNDTKHIVKELGNIKSTDFGSSNGGFNILNTPDELYINAEQFWREYNKPWLDNVISRNDIIKIATSPTNENLYRINDITGLKELTGFGREYTYLLEHGYIFDSSTMSMIPKR